MPAIKYQPRYTVNDYRQWEGAWKLWDGAAVAMSLSPFGRHQWAATRIAASISIQLEAQGCDDCFVLMETDWVVNDHTVVRPDISFCRGTIPERFIENSPTLIVEVLSDTTAEKDRISKRSLYKSEGVAHYVIFDTARERFQVDSRANDVFINQPASEPIQIELHDGCRIELTVPRLKKP